MYNLLVVLIDCLRQDRFEGKGKSAAIPILECFKNRSCYFDNVHTVGSNTTAVMGSWFTGLYPFNNGLRYFSDRKFDKPNLSTLASLLANRGYETLATVTDSLETGEDVLQGFNHIERRNKKKEAIYNGYGERVRQNIEHLNQSDRPWFYFVHSAELHHHRQCEAKFQKPAYGKTFYDRGLSCVDHYVGSILEAVNTDNTIVVIFGDHGDNLIFEPANDWFSFFVNILRSDQSLPGLHQFREFCYRRGILGRSKWILRNNFLFHHDYHVYRFLTHSPLMIALPGQTTPQRISAPVSSVDMFPTLLDYLGVPMPEATDGISLKPLIEGKAESLPKRAIYQEVFNENLRREKHSLEQLPQLSAVVVDDWKFMMSPLEPAGYPELYNLKSDPEERHNVYGSLENQMLVADLQRQLQDILAGVKQEKYSEVSAS